MNTTTRRSSLESQVYKLERSVFLRMCESIDSARAVTCFMLAEAEQWDQYLDLSRPDVDSASFADDYLLTECMRKNPRLTTSVDPKAVAITKWYEAEESCRMTNSRIRDYVEGTHLWEPGFEDLISNARSLISRILGPLNRSALEFIESKFRFGPGATSSCSGNSVVLSRKMTSDMDVTPRLYPYWRSIIPSIKHLGRNSVRSINLVASNKVSFVPKDSKTDRAIAIEPHMNIYVQLGIGAYLKTRLKESGLDLQKQATRNRELASVAHIRGLCTIDLSSASDTIAYELVKLLLPPDWFDLLSLCRCEYSDMEGSEIRLEKFSSMGNGYTFELETLIFWALSQASGDPYAVTYGDDIICSQAVAPMLIRTLNTLGFKVNEKKSFVAGRFFESCGADYLDGLDIRPFYFRGSHVDFTQAVIRICNKIRLYANRRNLGFGCDIRLLRAWLFCLHRSPLASKTGIPLNAGDDGLIRNFDEFCPSRATRGFQGWQGRVWHAAPIRSKRTDPLGAYVAALAWGTPDGLDSRLLEYRRGATSNATLSRVYVYTWDGPGPWCTL